MVYATEIEKKLFEFAPKELACEWDNVGLLFDSGAPVTKVLCALDITHDVVAQAIRQGCNLIVSHHPVIFRPLYTMSHKDVAWQLVQNGISAICMHTNLDATDGGVNDVLCKILNLTQIEPFGGNLGRIGTLEKAVSADDFIKICTDIFGACHVANSAKEVKKIAVLGGSGGDMMFSAFMNGADAYVTGEAAHHCAIAANSMGKLLVVAGHFATEHCIVNHVCEYIKQAFPKLDTAVSTDEKDPFVFVK